VLVFKHHPMDRGYCNYAMLLKRLGDEFGLGERLLYIHDQHLPSLLQAARGVVLVNSTVGLSALHHKAPLKVCGDSIYSIKGLVYQKSLDTFWADSKNFRINEVLLKRFLNYIIERTQVNGSFYKRLPIPGSTSGMRWDGRRGIEAWGRHIEGGVETAQRNRRSSDRRPNKYKLPETNHVERIPSKPRKAAN
jgi:capsular polysaccharide export protein